MKSLKLDKITKHHQFRTDWTISPKYINWSKCFPPCSSCPASIGWVNTQSLMRTKSPVISASPFFLFNENKSLISFSINQPATIKVATISSVFTPVISAHGRVFNRFIFRWEDVSYRFSPWSLQSLRSVYHETSSSVHQRLILHYIICICFNCYFIRTLTMLSLSLSLSPLHHFLVHSLLCLLEL